MSNRTGKRQQQQHNIQIVTVQGDYSQGLCFTNVLVQGDSKLVMDCAKDVTIPPWRPINSVPHIQNILYLFEAWF